MNAIAKWVKFNPTRAAAIATICIGWLGLVLPDTITTGLVTIVGILTGTAVYNSVTPTASIPQSPPPAK